MNTQWRPVIGVLAMLGLFAPGAYGQSALPWIFHVGATSVANGNEMRAEYFSTVAVQVDGVFAATVAFKKRTKDGTAYYPVQCTKSEDGLKATETTEPGYWECPGGAFLFRAEITAYTSGTVVVTGNGTTAVVGRGSGGGAAGLDANFDIRRDIDGANSEATSMIVGDGLRCWKFWGSVTDGAMVKPCIIGNTIIRIWPNYNLVIRDEEAGQDMFVCDPDATGQKCAWQPGYRRLKSVWIGAGNIYGDGVNCPERPTAVTINSGPKVPTFVCADNNGSRLNMSLGMPPDWDGSTFTLAQTIVQTAANTSALNGDTAWQCRGHSEAVSSTWGTEVPMDITNVSGSNDNDVITSGAITPAGTCAGGDMLYGYWDMDATGTTTAVSTLHILGFLLTYSSTS